MAIKGSTTAKTNTKTSVVIMARCGSSLWQDCSALTHGMDITIILSGSKVMVSIHGVTEHVTELGWGTKFSAKKIWARQNCHIRLRGNFGAQVLLAENFVSQFCHMFGGPCMLTMACLALLLRDAT